MLRKCIIIGFSLLFTIGSLGFIGCSVPTASNQSADDPDAAARAVGDTLYTTGWYQNGSYGSACYWKDTTRVDLDGSIANAVYVSSGTVYVSGSYDDAYNSHACYWKETTRYYLPGSSVERHHDSASSIFVTGGLVYLAGYYYEGGYKACMWIDDDGYRYRIDLPVDSSATGSMANSIYVDGTTTFVAGQYTTSGGGKLIARLWTSIGRGGSWVDLSTDFSLAIANSVYYSGGYVYVGGYYYNGSRYVACYWKWKGNSWGKTVSLTRTDLPGTNAKVTSLVVSGRNVYTAGVLNFDDSNGAGTACYWTNRRRTDLTTEKSRAFGIRVSGGTVYTAGYHDDGDYYHACTWKGKTCTDLEPDYINCVAYGLF